MFDVKKYLCNGVIGGETGLQSFLTGDSDADMCRLNHAHVISAVADRERDDFALVLDELHDFGLLTRRHAVITIRTCISL